MSVTEETLSNRPFSRIRTTAAMASSDKHAEGTSLPPVRRFITTHDGNGKAVFSDALPPAVEGEHVANMTFFNCFTTASFPADLQGDADVAAYKANHYPQMGMQLHVDGGTVIRIVEWAPSPPPGSDSPLARIPPLLHRTVSLDYGIMLEGEMEAILDSGETRLLRRGDIVVQRGTCHAWRNPSTTQPARIAFILTGIKPIKGPDGKELENYIDPTSLATTAQIAAQLGMALPSDLKLEKN